MFNNVIYLQMRLWQLLLFCGFLHSLYCPSLHSWVVVSNRDKFYYFKNIIKHGQLVVKISLLVLLDYFLSHKFLLVVTVLFIAQKKKNNSNKYELEIVNDD